MKKFAIILLLLTALLIPGGLVFASDITDALYHGVIQVSNNGTSNYTRVSTVFSANTTALIDNGFVSANLSDTAVLFNGSDIAFMPGYDTNPWVIWVDSINAATSINYDLYTDNVTGGEIRYFPADTGMTTSDHASLEISNNGTIEQIGFIDTSSGSNKNLIRKDDAFRTYVSNSGNVTSEVSVFERPTGFVDPDTQWSNETNAYDNDIATFAQETNIATSSWSSFVELTLPSTTLDTLKVYAGGSDPLVNEMDIDVYYDAAWNGVFNASFTQNTWITVTFPSKAVTAARIRLKNNHGLSKHGYLYEFSFYDTVEVTATGVSSGEHTVTTDIEGQYDDGDILHFPGTTNSIVDAGAIYDAAGTLWMSFWFKLDTTWTSGSGDKYIFAKRIDANNELLVWLESASGRMRFRNETLGVEHFNYRATAGINYTADTWIHTIASVSAVNGSRFIVNGNVTTDPDNTAIANGGNFIFGGHSSGLALGIAGEMANFIVGTDDLTGGEETDLLNNIAPGDEIDFWYMDEGSGTNIVSYGSSANAGTAASSTSWEFSNRFVYMTLAIDGTTEASFARREVNVPDNANDIISFENYAMPYVVSQEITIADVQQQYVEWEYATTFSDQSGNSNDATPNFRTTTTDADVTASLINFLPVSEAILSTFSLTDVDEILTGTPTQPSEMYRDLDFTNVPGADTANTLLTAGDIPQGLWWFPMLFGILAIIGLLIYKATTLAMIQGRIRPGLQEGSLLTMCIVIEVVLGLFAILGPLPLWPVILLAIPFVALILSRKHFSWG